MTLRITNQPRNSGSPSRMYSGPNKLQNALASGSTSYRSWKNAASSSESI